jgi:hypothetical protein
MSKQIISRLNTSSKTTVQNAWLPSPPYSNKLHHQFIDRFLSYAAFLTPDEFLSRWFFVPRSPLDRTVCNVPYSGHSLPVFFPRGRRSMVLKKSTTPTKFVANDPFRSLVYTILGLVRLALNPYGLSRIRWVWIPNKSNFFLICSNLI